MIQPKVENLPNAPTEMEMLLEMENKILREELGRLKEGLILSTPNEKDKVTYEEYIVRLKKQIQELNFKCRMLEEKNDKVKSGDERVVEKNIIVEKIVERVVPVEKIVEKIVEVEVPIEIIKYIDRPNDRFSAVFNELGKDIEKKFDFVTEFLEKKLIVDNSRIREIESQLNINNESSQK